MGKFNFRKANIKKNSFIYIMKCAGFYKIGYSRQPEKRLLSIQASNPLKVELIYFKKIRNVNKLEIQIHDEFLNKQIHGEWYALSGEDLEIIKETIKSVEKKNKVGNYRILF